MPITLNAELKAGQVYLIIFIWTQITKSRPLSIPVMRCRVMQTLYLLALMPIAEMRVDANAYGFRSNRSCADAIAQRYSALSRRGLSDKSHILPTASSRL